MRTSTSIIACCAVAALFVTEAFGQQVRVTTCDLSATASASNAESAKGSLSVIAQDLKLATPDVILLRGVSGWKMCSQLAELLKPAEYHVVSCSAFRQPGATNTAAQQVGILSKTVSYFSWSQPWDTSNGAEASGGFAFAAIKLAGHNFGFSVLEPGTTAKNSQKSLTKFNEIRQWLHTLDSFRTWENNRLEGMVAGSLEVNPKDADLLKLLDDAGFSSPAETSVSLTKPIQGHLVPNAVTPRGLLLAQSSETCEFDFNPAPPVTLVPALAVSTPAAPQSLDPRIDSGKPLGVWWWLGGACACALACILLIKLVTMRIMARLKAEGAVVLSNNRNSPMAYNVVVTPQTISTVTTGGMRAAISDHALPATNPHRNDALLRQGLMAQMSRWLKETFISRLLSERQNMLAVQEVATLKALAVDERLSKLETEIQEKNEAYQKRIDVLSRELLTAREENRELIRGQIAHLKAEMAAARKRIVADI